MNKKIEPDEPFDIIDLSMTNDQANKIGDCIIAINNQLTKLKPNERLTFSISSYGTYLLISNLAKAGAFKVEVTSNNNPANFTLIRK